MSFYAYMYKLAWDLMRKTLIPSSGTWPQWWQTLCAHTFAVVIADMPAQGKAKVYAKRNVSGARA